MKNIENFSTHKKQIMVCMYTVLRSVQSFSPAFYPETKFCLHTAGQGFCLLNVIVCKRNIQKTKTFVWVLLRTDTGGYIATLIESFRAS